MKSKAMLRKSRIKTKRGNPVKRSREGRQKAAKLCGARKPVDDPVKMEEPARDDFTQQCDDLPLDGPDTGKTNGGEQTNEEQHAHDQQAEQQAAVSDDQP